MGTGTRVRSALGVNAPVCMPLAARGAWGSHSPLSVAGTVDAGQLGDAGSGVRQAARKQTRAMDSR